MKQQLNLIDPRLLPVPARPSVATLLALLAAAGVAVLGHGGWERAHYDEALAPPGALQAEALEVSRPDPALQTLQRQVERDELLRDGLARASDLPIDSVGQLRQLSAALPNTLWLTDVELTGRNGLRIAGGALDVTALATYAARLSNIASLKGRQLQALTVEPQQPEALGDADGAAAERLPPHHLFVLASDGAQALNKDAR